MSLIVANNSNRGPISNLYPKGCCCSRVIDSFQYDELSGKYIEGGNTLLLSSTNATLQMHKATCYGYVYYTVTGVQKRPLMWGLYAVGCLNAHLKCKGYLQISAYS